MTTRVNTGEEAPQLQEAFSRLDGGLLLASLALTVAGGIAPENSKAQYVLAGLAAATYIKPAVSAFRDVGQATEPDHEVLSQHNAFGEL